MKKKHILLKSATALILMLFSSVCYTQTLTDTTRMGGTLGSGMVGTDQLGSLGFFGSKVFFTKEDSLKAKSLSSDWRGNLYIEFKVPDTSVVQIKVFDSAGYVKRIWAYRLVPARKLIVAEDDILFLNPYWEDVNVSYLYMNRRPIKNEDIDYPAFQ